MSCGAPKVIYDYDTTMDFKPFKTYHIFENAGDGLNELDVKRTIEAIDLKMKEMGFMKQDNPDFFIDFNAKRSENYNRNTLAIGIGNGGVNTSVGVSGGIPIDNDKYIEELTIDFVEATLKQELFWQGTLASKIGENTSPKKRIAYLNKAVYKILQGYPPKY